MKYSTPSTIFVSLPNIVAFFASTNYVCDIQIYYSSIFYDENI